MGRSDTGTIILEVTGREEVRFSLRHWDLNRAYTGNACSDTKLPLP